MGEIPREKAVCAKPPPPMPPCTRPLRGTREATPERKGEDEKRKLKRQHGEVDWESTYEESDWGYGYGKGRSAVKSKNFIADDTDIMQRLMSIMGRENTVGKCISLSRPGIEIAIRKW